MNLSSIKENRLNSLNEKYKPIIKTYNDTINIVNSISVDDNEPLDIIICKLYILTNNVNQTLKILITSNFKINNRKINSTDISETLKAIPKNEKNIYRLFARNQFINNKRKSKLLT